MLESFLDGDSYSSIGDYRRFNTIDNQLNRISELSGDGVINGWNIESSTFPYIIVTSGSGIISKYYVNTFGDQSFELAPNGIFHVYAQHRSGIIGLSGPKSDVGFLTYVDAGPPSAPSGFNVMISSQPGSWVSPYILSLQWTTNTESDLDHYEIEYSNDGSVFEIIDDYIDKTLTEYEDAVIENTTHYYRLYAVDQSGNRSLSSTSSLFTPLSNMLPPNPVSVQMPASEAGINFLWKQPPSIHMNRIDHWLITITQLMSDGSENESTTETRIVNKNLLYDRIDDLSIGIQYKAMIQSVDLHYRISSGISMIVTPQPNPGPRDPQGIAYSIEPDSEGVKVNLSWVSGETPYDPMSSYKYIIYTTVNGQQESVGRNVSPGETSKSISLYELPGNIGNWNIIPENILVTFRIVAVSGPPNSGLNSFGNYIRFMTSVFSEPTRIGALTSSFDFNTGKITIEWINQTDTNYVQIIIIDDDLEDAYITDLEIVNSNLVDGETSYIFDAELNHKYTITVTPFNINDTSGPISTVVEVTTVGIGLALPSVPESLSADSSDREIQLTWSASTTLFTNGYRVYRRVGSISTNPNNWRLVDTLPHDINRFTDYGLTNGQTYSYYVTSLDIYGRESNHLSDGFVNMNFVESVPLRSGIITEPFNVEISLVGSNIFLTWESIPEEFDGFTIYRSMGDLHHWEVVTTVNRNTFSYTDIELTQVDGTTFYYIVDKSINDSDIIVQTSNVTPEGSILLGSIVVGDDSITSIDTSVRRNIKDMADPISEYTNTYLLPHRHLELSLLDSERIDLNPELIITDWTTVDGRIFTTNESNIDGENYIVKVNNRFPEVFFQVDASTRRLLFSEAIVDFDEETGTLLEEIPEIEVKVVGIEEVQSNLDTFRFDRFHARQIQFGSLNKEQIPPIGHEGRIREELIPKRFLLERYSNHIFMPVEGTTDETKNFGDGTTFFAIVASDGKIEEVIDFDLEDDEDMVGFRNPAFSSTTSQHLKQNILLSNLGSGNDNANYYLFKTSNYYALVDDIGNNSGYLFNVSNLNSWTRLGGFNVSNSTWNVVLDHKNKFIVSHSSSVVYTVDVATGNMISSHVVSGIVAMAYNADDGNIYEIDSSDNLYIIDPLTGSTTLVAALSGAASIRGMAYDTQNNTMYIVDNVWLVWTLNLSTAVATSTTVTITNSPIATMGYQKSTNRLYVPSSIGNNLTYLQLPGFAETVEFTLTDYNYLGIGFPNENWWISGSDKLRLGDFTGLRADIYLRFQISIPSDALPSISTLHFTGHTEASVGDDVNLRVSVLNPSGISSSTDLQLVSVASVDTLSSLDWSPPIWSAEEDSDNTSVNITSLVSDFVNDSNYISGNYMFLKIETLSTTSLSHHRTAYSYDNPTKAPYLDTSHVFDLAEVNSDPGGFQSEKSYHFRFEFNDMSSTRWVRLTTSDTLIKPNPVLNLKKRLRFKMLMESGSIYVALGIREIDVATADIGSDGGVSGSIEWVNVTSTIDNGEGNLTPVGMLVNSSPNWQEVDINIPKAAVVSFENGNGVLTSDFGVLEHLAFTINPIDPSATGPFDIYIDKLEQVSDVLASGTSQGIQVSTNFGTTWEVSRLTSTPVHKFYRAQNNQFLWAISTDEVLLSVDPAHWFTTSGTAGVQYIRDITEDNEGNMYISTDKGVYWLEISLLHSFSTFRQTQPVNAFSTECYALYHNPVSSGIDEIWVSTELGVYKTDNKGSSWTDTGINTEGLVAYEIINISSDSSSRHLIAITRKHVLRMLQGEVNFSVLANLESQHGIYDIWTISHFSNKLYVSTGFGVYTNDMDVLITPTILDTQFSKVLPSLDFNGLTRVAFCLDVVDLGDLGEKLFIGQENRLVSVDKENIIGLRVEYRNKDIPSFYIDDNEINIGYVYNAFNNVFILREPLLVNKIVTASFLPRRQYITVNGGWSQTNPDADVFIYKNGIPMWLDWTFDDNSILSILQSILDNLEAMPALTTFNSLTPNSQTYLDNSISDINIIKEGGEIQEGETVGGQLINDTTIIHFMNDYTRFLSLITESLANDNELVSPRIFRTGMSRIERSPGSRADILEEKENFEADNSVGINIDIVEGEVDFLTAFSQATTPEDRSRFSFTKYDRLNATIFNSNMIGSGEFTHRELEDKMEDVNTGLTSDLANTVYSDMIKLGIFSEREHPFMFDRYNTSNIQSKFYAAHTNSWYDILNSTLDYKTIISVANSEPVRYINSIVHLNGDPYFSESVWIGTDGDIIQVGFDSDGSIIIENTIRPGGGFLSYIIWDIFVHNDTDIYVVAAEQESEKGHIFVTSDFGSTWEELQTFNLPDKLYKFILINGIKVITTESGSFYSDNNFGTWYPSDIVLSDVLGIDTSATDAFKTASFNLESTTFAILCSDRWFYTSGNGVEFFAINRLNNNSATVINKILRFKNLTWVATDKGLYDDGNSILSDNIQFGLQQIENSLALSIGVSVNDIVNGIDAVYCCGSNGKIYRYLDVGLGNEWKSYTVHGFGTIHKMILKENSDNHYLYIISHNKMTFVNVTDGSGVFG